MLDRLLTTACLIFFGAYGLWYFQTAWNASHHPPHRIQIKLPYETSNRVERDAVTTNNASPVQQPSEPKKNTRHEEASEITIFGIRIGEALVALFTFLLWGATVALVWEAKRSSHRQLRAYVWAKPIRVMNLSEGHHVGIQFELRNAGQTPAYETIIGGVCLVEQNPFPAGAPFPIFEIIDANAMVLHPHSEPPLNAEVRTPATVGGFTIATIIQGTTHRLCAYILIRYRDAFGNNWVTRGCFQVAIDGPIRPDGSYPVTFAHVGENTAT